MSTKHTPGPWSWNLVRVQRAITGAQGEPVAYVHGEGVSEAESEANASLISAAPDLLAACKNSRDIIATDRQAYVDCQQLRDRRVDDPIAHGLVWVSDGVWLAPGDDEALRDYDRALHLIDSAIAKATGAPE